MPALRLALNPYLFNITTPLYYNVDIYKYIIIVKLIGYVF